MKLLEDSNYYVFSHPPPRPMQTDVMVESSEDRVDIRVEEGKVIFTLGWKA